MQMIEMKLNMIIDNNPHVIIAHERSINHPSMKKHSDNPIQIETISFPEKISFHYDC